MEDTAHFVCTIINTMPMRGRNARTIKVENVLGPTEEMLTQMKEDRRRKRRKARGLEEDD